MVVMFQHFTGKTWQHARLLGVQTVDYNEADARMLTVVYKDGRREFYNPVRYITVGSEAGD